MQYVGHKSTTYCDDKGCKQSTPWLQRASIAALSEAYKGADPDANLHIVACVSYQHTTICNKTATDVELLVATCRECAQQHYQRLTRDTGTGTNLQVVAHVSCKHITMCRMKLALMLSSQLKSAGNAHNSTTIGLQRDHITVCDETANNVELLVATCRERAQQHYQRLTRELTQGQLLRLGHRDSFIQQASFVLLKGELYVRGETEGDTLSVSGSVFGFRGSLMLAGRHAIRGLFLCLGVLVVGLQVP